MRILQKLSGQAPEELIEHYGLGVEGIEGAVKRVINRKQHFSLINL